MRIKFKKGRLGEWTDWFEIRPGFDYADNYNETLDNARINIDHLENELDIEPYDIAKIEVYGSYVYYMVVDNYIKQQISFTPDIFNYEINLMSPTKCLENYILSSFSITKKDDMTGRTIKYYADKLLLEAQYLHDKFASNSPFRFGTLSEEILNTIVSEVQMQEPTLREALNNLFMQKDRLAVIRDFDETNNQWIITDLAINVTGSEITDKHNINYIEESQNSAEYVSDIKINMQNATQSEIKTPIIGYRNEERYIMSTDDLQLPTSYPIWKLNKLYVGVYVDTLKGWYESGPTPSTTVIYYYYKDMKKYYLIDVTEFVSEFNLWQTKNVYYAGWYDDIGLDSQYRNTSLFYRRGERGIFNFEGYKEWKALYISGNRKWVWELLEKYVEKHVNEIPEIVAGADEVKTFCREHANLPSPGHEQTWGYYGIQPEIDAKALAFKVNYVPLYNSYMLANKKPFNRNVRQIVDNQETQLIDISKLGLLEYLKVNRLGNKVRIVNARYELDEYNLIPQLAQKINGSIIFKRELKVMNDYIIANYYTTDNYVLRDYYTGVRARLRSWRTTVDEDLIKHIHLRFYGNNNLSDYDDGTNLIPAHYNNIDYLENLFKNATCCITTPITSIYGENKVMLLEHTVSRSGNSILVTFKLKDNATIGKYISNFNGTGGQEQKDYKYTDEFGECNWFYIQFGNYVSFPSPEAADDAIKKYPLYDLNKIENIFFKLKYEYQKDNKEAPQFTLQFDFNEDATNIFYNNK